jgi:GNAT superfamily N-acetyltransferase
MPGATEPLCREGVSFVRQTANYKNTAFRPLHRAAICAMKRSETMSDTRIEPATLEDLPDLADLLYELFSKEADFRPDQTKQMRGLRLIIEQPSRGRIFVLRHFDKLIGMMNLLFTISTAEGGFVMILEDLIICQEHRGQNYGSQMLDYAIEFAKQKDFLRITLLTDRLDEPAKHFFHQHHFHESKMVPMRWRREPEPPFDPPQMTY